MRKRKIINSMFALMLAGIVASPFGMMNAKASNWTDTKYSLRYNGDGGDVSTGKRQKQDDSYVYIKHMGNVGAWVSVRVVGYSGNYTGMNGSGSYVKAPLGTGYKITNYVAESFPADYKNGRYKTIYLQLSPETHNPTTLYGWWSPDSI